MNTESIPEGTRIHPLWLYWNYDSGVSSLEILIRNLDSEEIVRVPINKNTNIDFRIGENRYCIGYPDENDKIIPCDSHRKVSKGFQCYECIKKDKLLGCVFCKGTECVNKDAWNYCQSNKHTIYLAVYTQDYIKVGTSNKNRVLSRLLEQGAQIAMIVGTLENQMEAKLYEEKISKDFNIPQRTSRKILLESISKRIDKDKARTDLGLLLEKIQQKYDRIDYSGEIINLFEPSVSDTHIKEIKPNELLGIKGQIRYIHGKYLVIGNSLINARDLIGRELIIGGGKEIKPPQLSLSDY